MTKKCGKLFYDENDNRYDILFEDGIKYGGLHCGEVFEVLVEGYWKYVRIEIDSSGMWYFKGLDKPGFMPEDVRV